MKKYNCSFAPIYIIFTNITLGIRRQTLNSNKEIFRKRKDKIIHLVSNFKLTDN